MKRPISYKRREDNTWINIICLILLVPALVGILITVSFLYPQVFNYHNSLIALF
jgi:hypothetical protein